MKLTPYTRDTLETIAFGLLISAISIMFAVAISVLCRPEPVQVTQRCACTNWQEMPRTKE